VVGDLIGEGAAQEEIGGWRRRAKSGGTLQSLAERGHLLIAATTRPPSLFGGLFAVQTLGWQTPQRVSANRSIVCVSWVVEPDSKPFFFCFFEGALYI